MPCAGNGAVATRARDPPRARRGVGGEGLALERRDAGDRGHAGRDRAPTRVPRRRRRGLRAARVPAGRHRRIDRRDHPARAARESGQFPDEARSDEGGHAMTVTPAVLTRPEAREGSTPFVPSGFFRGGLADFDYVEEEWFATGEAEGHPYVTTVYVRRPRDPARFSGVVMVEPVHAMSAAPVWQYVAPYMMRAGHGFAAVGSQKSALEAHVKPSDPERYASLEIWSDAPPP